MEPVIIQNPEPRQISDSFGRTFRYLRLSVTDRCNLACQYCNPTDLCAPASPDLLSWDDLVFVARTCVEQAGVRALRITGGEPTVRPGLIEWIQEIRSLCGLEDLSMTTNAVMLKSMSGDLLKAGLDRVNISLDCFNPERFRLLTRGGDVARVLDGIQVARQNFRSVKLNCVALRSVFEPEIDQFLKYSSENGIEIRFIELMPIFDQKEFFEREFISTDEMQQIIAARGWNFDADQNGSHGQADHGAPGFGPAQRVRVMNDRIGEARLGFISQMSDTKCLTCNKLRVTSDGSLKPCLLMPEEISLSTIIRDRDAEELLRVMKRYFQAREEAYTPDVIRHEKVSRGMQAIGG